MGKECKGRKGIMMLKESIKGEILIYGAHLVALECCRFLAAYGKKNSIVGFAVTDQSGNPEELEGYQVKEIDEYVEKHQSCVIVIAMPEKYHDAVESYARKKGFKNFIKVNLEEMSILKGMCLISEQQRHPEFSFILEENNRDSSWLNIRNIQEHEDRYYKFPTLFYKSIEETFREAEKFDFQKEYRTILGEYRNLHKIEKSSTREKKRSKTDIIQIFMIFSKGDSAVISMDKYEPWICPLQVGGRASKMKLPCLYDDEGESISDKNNIFAEMTGAYWIWKNINEVDYKGLCHYRRHFVISEDELQALEQNGIDVILTIPRYVPYGVGNMFLAETPVKETVFESMFQAVHECFPEDEENFKTYLGTCFYYPNNMVIARNYIYDAYCEWVFRILFRMMEIEEKNEYGHDRDRHIAYAAELLTSYFFSKHKDEYCIAVTEYEFLS